jgi:hypothetical protein
MSSTDSAREVLVLYRERSGEESCGDAGVMSAAAFSIQRLEGSRYGTVELWVLNGGERRNRAQLTYNGVGSWLETMMV